MRFWDAIENLFRGPRSTADGLPFAHLRAEGSPARESYAAVADLLPTFELGKARWPDYDVAQYDASYRKLALVFRCLSLITHAAGTAKVRVYDEANDDEEIADHPMRRLIRQPNARMGEARFWGTVALRAGVAGFCVVEKERDGFGDVIALNPLRSSWLKAIPMGRGVYDWEYRIPGNTQRLAAANVIVFTWADTTDGSPYGLPPLATAVRDVAILDKLTQFIGNLLDRGGVPIWMLFPKTLPGQKLDQEAIDEMEQRFERRRGGFERRGFPWIADGFEKAERLSYDIEELAMTALRDLSDLAICQAFGVPPRKAGVRIGLEHTTQNATASVEDGEFYRDTIVPLWTRLDDALTTGLLPDFEPPDSSISLEFDTDDVEALKDSRSVIEAASLAALTGGAIPLNRFLAETGRPTIGPVGDVYRTLFNVTWLTVDELHGTNANAPLFAPVVREGQTVTDAQKSLAALTDHERMALDIGSGSGVALSAPGPTDRLAKRKAIGESNKKLIANIAEAREPSLKTFLRDQANRIATTVSAPLGSALARSNGHAAQTYSVAEIDWSYESNQLERVIRQLYQLAGSTAFDAASDALGIGIDFDLANPRIADVLDRLALRVVDITQVTRDTIAQLVSDGLTAGKTITAIADEIKASTLFNQVRANRIARTESMVSYGEASVLAYRESGVVDRAQIFDNANHTDSYGASDGLTCAERDGIVVPLDEAMDHIYADHPNGSACAAPVLTGED